MSSGSLKGRTLFITGASRGIGKAIALRAAKDGANVVIAAKTADPHPKLSGTIYTAKDEIEAAGGKALACIVDVRMEDQIKAAVDLAVSTFGGIDILVNNASAISLTGTVDTPLKRFDLMHGINTRGTFACSQACIPHLLKSDNAHILNISPPLNMEAKWFAPHVAYTMAKFGMSLCVLGMSAELAREDGKGVAVNALWPRTVIATAAVENLLGGDATLKGSRKPEIMADAAHAVLTGRTTGHFYIDDEVLRANGNTDLSHYAVTPGTKDEDLFPDYFL